MRGLALNFASTHQTENPLGFSEVGENKQLLIAIVIASFYCVGIFPLIHCFFCFSAPPRKRKFSVSKSTSPNAITIIFSPFR
ncbi:MAG: hypothetical protein CMC19_08105 [Flavobacteriaceae bacterium]|nr:hypothetical protein [Flavobacteriaceae bacterium]OUX39376.1 MAG: hypothetical protein CBE25_04135 [Flavobacteriaceae bacterium TMED265]